MLLGNSKAANIGVEGTVLLAAKSVSEHNDSVGFRLVLPGVQ